MPLAAEVNVLQAEVRRHQHFVAAWDPQHGAVIADSPARSTVSSRGSAANTVNQQLFLQGHGQPPGMVENSVVGCQLSVVSCQSILLTTNNCPLTTTVKYL
jgi:hypothetical protein